MTAAPSGSAPTPLTSQPHLSQRGVVIQEFGSVKQFPRVQSLGGVVMVMATGPDGSRRRRGHDAVARPGGSSVSLLHRARAAGGGDVPDGGRLQQTECPAAWEEIDRRSWATPTWNVMVLSANGWSDHARSAVAAGTYRGQAGRDPVLGRQWTLARARVLLDEARLAEARSGARAFLGTVDELGAGDAAEITAWHVLGRVAASTGDDAGLIEAEGGIRRMRASTSVLVRGAGAWLSAVVGDRSGADDLDGIDPRGPWWGGPLDPADVPAFVRVALDAGRRGSAEQAVAAVARRARATPSSTLLDAAHAHAVGLLHRDPHSCARAARVLAGAARPLALASALEDHGRLAAADDRTAAVASLEEALRLQELAGAHRDAARARALLRGVGVHRRPATPRRGGHGWDALTPAELAVTWLVAQGATNREVAERLHLSPHTVGTHLRHTFAKLDISSRVELTRQVLSRSPL